MNAFATLSITLGLAAAFYGWGAATATLLRLEIPRGFMPAVGAATVVVLGGPLLVFGLGSGWTPMFVLATGVVYAGWDLLRSMRKRSGMPSGVQWQHFFVALITLPLLVWMSAQPTTLNAHDDFEKYLKYAVRIFDTGTLDPGPFSTAGVAVLGGMSWL